MNRVRVICIVICTAGFPVLAAKAAERPSAFTAAQAEAGRVELRTNSFGDCSTCHASNLGGRNGGDELSLFSSLTADSQKLIDDNGGYVPDLVGAKFRERWNARSTKKTHH